jgi:hypothetical protein
MTLTAENSKTELSTELQEEFVLEFADVAPERIHEVFRQWRKRSPFMPAISDIAELLRLDAEQQRLAGEAERRAAQSADTQAARKDWDRHCEENGIPVGTSQRDWVMKQALEKVRVVPFADRVPVRSPRNVLALSQGLALKRVGRGKQPA